FMVEAAREQGFVAAGIEPDRMAVEFARTAYPRNEYFEGLLETADLGERQFDVIYCSEVIEHAPDCHAFLTRLTAIMKDGGLLYLTTPDIDHWRRPKNILEWDGFAPPGHCLYFNPTNLEMLLARHGLAVVRRSFAWKPGIKLYARKARAASVRGRQRAAACRRHTGLGSPPGQPAEKQQAGDGGNGRGHEKQRPAEPFGRKSRVG